MYSFFVRAEPISLLTFVGGTSLSLRRRGRFANMGSFNTKAQRTQRIGKPKQTTKHLWQDVYLFLTRNGISSGEVALQGLSRRMMNSSELDKVRLNFDRSISNPAEMTHAL